MGRLFIQELSGSKIFKCNGCKVDTASLDDLISKDFNGRFGRAFLFRNVVNITIGHQEEKSLRSGLHITSDIYCSSCQRILGWKYEKAYEESQKYKEGMFILETTQLLKEG